MTPPERPEVGGFKRWSEVRRPKEAVEPLTPAEEASLRANLKPGERRNIARVLATLDAERKQRAAEPLRGALLANLDEAELEAAYAKRIGKPGYAAAHLDGMIGRLRAALEATASSTPEPALERLAQSWETVASRVGDRMLIGDPAAAMAQVSTLRSCANELRVALTSEPRAAAPQPGDADG